MAAGCVPLLLESSLDSASYPVRNDENAIVVSTQSSREITWAALRVVRNASSLESLRLQARKTAQQLDNVELANQAVQLLCRSLWGGAAPWPCHSSDV